MSTESKSVNWTIGRQKITTVPTQNGTQYVTGSNVTVSLKNYDSNKLTLGGTYQASTAGSYTATVTPKDNYCWSDGTYGAKNVSWTLTSAYKVMTVIIDQTNSNPETCCTYADDATSMTAGSSAWDTFFGYYPVMLSGGVEGKKLNPNDYTKHTDGTSADITSGAEGDVMIAFPKMGIKITTDSSEKIRVSMTDNPNASGYSYLAHTRGSTVKDKFYLGAYKGYNKDGKLRSLSGVAPTTNITIGTARNYARANSPASNGSGGSGYDQSGWYQMIFRQVMYVLKYKNLNSQAVLGKGIVSGSKQNTGGTNANGLNYGDTTNSTTHVKCFGIEDMWGNIWEWIDGMFSDSSRNVLTATQGFNDTGANYTNRGQASTGDIGWNFANRVQGTSDMGFLIKANSGSSTTYFCDKGGLYGSCLPVFGGNWDNGDGAGVFCLYVAYSATSSDSYVGARLMFL